MRTMILNEDGLSAFYHINVLLIYFTIIYSNTSTVSSRYTL